MPTGFSGGHGGGVGWGIHSPAVILGGYYPPYAYPPYDWYYPTPDYMDKKSPSQMYKEQKSKGLTDLSFKDWILKYNGVKDDYNGNTTPNGSNATPTYSAEGTDTSGAPVPVTKPKPTVKILGMTPITAGIVGTIAVVGIVSLVWYHNSKK